MFGRTGSTRVRPTSTRRQAPAVNNPSPGRRCAPARPPRSAPAACARAPPRSVVPRRSPPHGRSDAMSAGTISTTALQATLRAVNELTWVTCKCRRRTIRRFWRDIIGLRNGPPRPPGSSWSSLRRPPRAARVFTARARAARLRPGRPVLGIRVASLEDMGDWSSATARAAGRAQDIPGGGRATSRTEGTFRAGRAACLSCGHHVTSRRSRRASAQPSRPSASLAFVRAP